MRYALFWTFAVGAPGLLGGRGLSEIMNGGNLLWWLAIAYLIAVVLFCFGGAIGAGLFPRWYKRSPQYRFVVWLWS